MSNAFTNFLGGVVSGVFGGNADLKDYQHASRLYVANTYARAPKTGFLYFVAFDINSDAIADKKWAKNKGDIGLLVKKTDLPKFTIATEPVNQYNRKTLVQTGIKYAPISLEFHDDNSNLTQNLWKNYYEYYYRDSASTNTTDAVPQAFSDTKYSTTDYAYGINNNRSIPFFKTIDIYVLYQHKYTQITLVNPKVSDWAHDSVDQEAGNKILSSKMTVQYETVLYRYGDIKKGSHAGEFTAKYYDNTPSPLSIGGNGATKLFGANGVIAGAESVFGILGKENATPLDYLAAAIQTKTLVKNVSQLNKAGLAKEGYSILSGALGNISTVGNQPDGLTTANVTAVVNQSILGAAGTTGINLFSGKNSSITGQITAMPFNSTGNKPI